MRRKTLVTAVSLAYLTVVIGAAVGATVGLALIALKRIRRDQYIPFGPFLALGAVVAMFFFNDIKAWYVGLLIR